MGPAPTKILLGISLDPEDSKELLSWAIRVIAQPNDTIVALHVIATGDLRQGRLRKKDRAKLRQAKAQVISLVGEFSWTCQSKQVNLEAKVGFSHSTGKGLIEESKSLRAGYILLRGSRSHSNRASHEITRYCLEHAPVGCTLVSVGKCRQPKPNSSQNFLKPRVEDDKCSSRGPTKIKDSAPPIQKHNTYEKMVEKALVDSTSPRTVLDEVEGDSNSTEDDSFSFGDSTYSTISESTLQDPKLKDQTKSRKQMFPTKLISSFFSSPLRKRRESFCKIEKPQDQNYHQQPLLKCFSYEEISEATNNFHPDSITGRGGYSEVYKGYLSDGAAIAVKRLAKDNKDANKEKEFLTELGVIGHVCHPNTANLLGCCIENGLYLIFKFSQNGNLASALHGGQSKPLNWPNRYKIALGVARGLHYLHRCCKRRIIHRDIKASNVLLGPDYEPQITDFGLAKWLPNKWTHHAVVPIEGTFGYLAPEYFMHGVVDEKTDVFAFGVLLMEIITGRQPVNSSNQNLLIWARPLMESGNIVELADPNLDGDYDMDQMQRLVLTASYCISQSATWRPSMSEVLELLTNDQDSEVAKTWSTSKSTTDDLDDYSMVFGYDVPTDISLDSWDLEDLL